MRLRVALVLELVERDGTRNFSGQFLCLALRAEHPLLARRVDDLRTEGAEERLFFGRKLCRHNEQQLIAAVQRRKCDAKPGVSGGSKDDGRTGFEDAGALCITNHI